MQKFLSWIKQTLLALLRLIVLFYGVFFAVLFYQYNRDPVIDQDDQHLVYVVEWLKLDYEPRHLLHSYHAPANWAGDYEKMFALQLTAETLEALEGEPRKLQGDQLNPEIESAVSLILVFTEDCIWFPTEEQIYSDAMWVIPTRHVYKGGYSDSAHLAFVDRESGVLYFAAVKM